MDIEAFIGCLIIGILMFAVIAIIPLNWRFSIPYIEVLQKTQKRVKEPELYKKYKRKWQLIFLFNTLVYAIAFVSVSVITQKLLIGFFTGIIMAGIGLGLIGKKAKKDKNIIEKEVLVTITKTEGDDEQILRKSANIKKITKEDLRNTPWWIWIFIVACAILPITTIGGAIPVCLATLGILSCINISARPVMKKPLKFLVCLGISALAWGISYLFIFALSQL